MVPGVRAPFAEGDARAFALREGESWILETGVGWRESEVFRMRFGVLVRLREPKGRPGRLF